ncbi:MAG: hypothetical protein IPG02_07100 [Ignavibacteria bacterium]|nr:hypothetical protein [Ignavibacteria bacterium]
MKIVFVFFLMFSLSTTSITNAALTGTKTIPGNYPTIADAIADLNFQGVGTGGVVFNVAAGHSESAANLVISITTSPTTSSNTVVFQKSGVGANPLITAAPGTSATADAIIKIAGDDYITFDGIDLLDPATNSGNAMMEWGYSLMRADSTDGTQYVTIKNCTVVLQKINTASIGIYIANRDTNGITFGAIDERGQNSYNRIYGNTIANVYKGIVAISSSLARDVDNEIGVNGQTANNITNWGGSTLASEGIRCEGQINLKINNNEINGGSGTTNAVVGIIATLFGTTALAPNYEISHNHVTVTSSSSSSATYGIRALATADTVRIHHNIVENCVTNHTTSAFYGLTHDGTGTSEAVYIYNNIVRNNTHSGTGSANLLSGNGTFNSLLIRANQVYGNQKSGASGTMNCILASTSSVECDSNQIYNNSIPGSSGTAASTIYGYINSGSPPTESVHNNTIYNLSIGGGSTSASVLATGIRTNSASTTVKNIFENQIYGISTIGGNTTTGGAYGIYSSIGADAKIYRNRIYNITNTGSAGTAGGCWVSSGTAVSVYNNFISQIKAPNSGNPIAVTGINITSTTANSIVKVYFNSVYLNASGGSTFGSAGLSVTASATSTTAALDLKNNLIINHSAPGSLSGQSVAYRRSSVNLQNFGSESNYNLFHAGTPSFNRLIFVDGVNGDQTIDSYKTRVAPREANSNSDTVSFQSVANGDLHIAGGSIGNSILVGMPIAGITNDYDNDTRSLTYPYKGADESTAITIPVLNLTLNLEACSPMQDTITVYLRNAGSPYAIVDVTKGNLSPSGTVSLNFPNAVNGVNYYIVVKHRNSVETWSKAGGEMFSSGALNFDFTTAASQAYGSNMVLVGGEYSIFTGDVNDDDIVDAADVSLIDNDAFNFVSGYVVTDLNCDGSVDGTDATFGDNNAFNFVGIIRP